MSGMGSLMKPLTERQAQACENARHLRCRCRCGGRFYGAGRIASDAPREDFAALGQDDPHFLPMPGTKHRCGSAARAGLERMAGVY